MVTNHSQRGWMMTYLSEQELDKADAWADKDLTEYWSYPEIGQDREVEDAEES